ncbi:hypothetical protein Clacol_009101 [Clathrus columnatus]|uniref:Uncharacterized protein n=1 Tax=Clathrus columnatus TaxID=1419009 RepID=A0AAV5AQ79_9AGAM|nr:hypothetical protein Clacol_009101 [Clathrus columnatus]
MDLTVGLGPSNKGKYSKASPLSIPIPTLLNNPISTANITAENSLNTALNDLVLRGALQIKNQMDIEALLDPAVKLYTADNSTNEDIYHLVMAVIDAREKIDEDGGDDVDNDHVTESHSTPKVFFHAALIIN